MSPDNWPHMIIFSCFFWLPLYFFRHFEDLRDKQLNWPEYAGPATSCGGLVLTKLRRTHKLAEGHFISTATFFMVTNAHTLISWTYLKLFRFVPKKLTTLSKTTTIAGRYFYSIYLKQSCFWIFLLFNLIQSLSYIFPQSHARFDGIRTWNI